MADVGSVFLSVLFKLDMLHPEIFLPLEMEAFRVLRCGSDRLFFKSYAAFSFDLVYVVGRSWLPKSPTFL